MAKKRLVPATEWRRGHPKEIGHLPSDMYYAQFCTRLLNEIDSVFARLEVPSEWNMDLALQIGHYVEDVDGTEGIDDHRYILTDLATLDGSLWETNGLSVFVNQAPEKPTQTLDGKPAYDYYMKLLKGKPIAYFKNLDDLQKRLFKDTPNQMDEHIRRDLSKGDGIVAFVNTDGTVNLSSCLAPTLPDPKNPYFKQIDRSLLMGALLNESIASTEMVQYFLSQGWLDELSLASARSPERGHALLHDNIDFFLRYFRGGEYGAKK